MATFLFKGARAAADALLAGWVPLRWEMVPRMKLAALRMRAPEGLHTARAHRAAGLLVLNAYEWDSRRDDTYFVAGEKPWSEECRKAFLAIEAELGPRPKAD